MTGKVLGGAALVLHFTVVIFIGYGMQLPVQPPVKPAPIVAEAPEGPRCTIAYPRGVKPERITKRRPVCKNGDLQSIWGGCQLQYRT